MEILKPVPIGRGGVGRAWRMRERRRVGAVALVVASFLVGPWALRAQAGPPPSSSSSSHGSPPSPFLAQASWASGPSPAISVLDATIPELQEAMDRGELTSVELVEIYLARMEAYDENGARLNAILRVNPRAREEASALDRERAQGRVRGPLHGIPVILKDNYDTYDLATTAGSVALARLVPPDDAFQVAKLREAGAVLLAKANMHELAMGIVTVSSLGGYTRNPYDPARNPGGSSGGTGAAIAAAFAAVGWGTDTCGSIRIPACFNNLFGLRPTKGLSSIDGIIPLSHTQDVGGPLARNVTDLAVALDATVGPDPADPATKALEGRELPRFLESLDPDALRGARLGVVQALFGDPVEDREVDRLLRETIGRLVMAGADTVSVDIPDIGNLLATSSTINYEAKSDIMNYLAATPGAPVTSLRDILDLGLYHTALQEPIQRRERLGSLDSEDYLVVLERQKELASALQQAMDEQDLDALVFPSVRRRPTLIGESQGGSNCQVSAGSGFPAMALPGGFTQDGLPTALEVLGRPFDDARLVAMAYAYEQAVHPRRNPHTAPPLVDGKAPLPMVFDVLIRGTRGEVGSARGRFAFDPVTRDLAFDLEIVEIPAGAVSAVALHRMEGSVPGPILHRLMGPGQLEGTGTIVLGSQEVEDLVAGRLHLALYSATRPRGLGAALRLPQSPPS